MTLKTKDILKILKLVKKSKKAKKRSSKHKKKINITTQQIGPSTLQPYEISRQPFNNTNNIQLDNMRLSNKVLENKLIEPDNNKNNNNNNLKAIEDKLNLAIGYNNLQDKLNLTTSSISDIKNENMGLNNKSNRVIDFGNNFIAETKRNFDNHELKLLEKDKVKLDSKKSSEQAKEEKPDLNLSAVFDNPDDYFEDVINPASIETFSFDNPIYKQKPVNPLFTTRFLDRKEETKTEQANQQEETKTEQPNQPEETKTEQPNQHEETKIEQANQPEEDALNTSNVSNTEEDFLFKKIKNQKILRALLKKIETKETRRLTEAEKNVLKPFYKKYNVNWSANTQFTGKVKTQLEQFKNLEL